MKLGDELNHRIPVLERLNSLVKTFQPPAGLLMRSRRFPAPIQRAPLLQKGPEACVLTVEQRRRGKA